MVEFSSVSSSKASSDEVSSSEVKSCEVKTFSPWVIPLNRRTTEPTPTGGVVEYEEFPSDIEVVGPLLHLLFQTHWQEIELGHVVEGSVLELSLTAPPKKFVLYDGYLTVVTEAWHLHLCLEENRGGPTERTPTALRQQRQIKRAALYRRLNDRGRAVSWGIQFWNGSDERMMTLFLSNPYVGRPEGKPEGKAEGKAEETTGEDSENLLPEGKPQLEKLRLYEQLRAIHVLGTEPMPFQENPLKRPYLAVCRSTRCNPSGNWQPTFEALKQATQEAGLDIPVQSAGCLEVCKLGPVVFHSGDRTWYTRVTPAVAKQIVQSHLVEGQPLISHSLMK